MVQSDISFGPREREREEEKEKGRHRCSESMTDAPPLSLSLAAHVRRLVSL